MGIVRGLKAINKHVEDEEAKFSGNGGGDATKTKWFSIKDKQSFKIAFLQEMDEDAKNFSLKNDIGFIATEHASPANFQVKALCTKDDDSDDCYGCEQHQKDYKAKWGQKSRLYINVLVDNGKDEPFVAVLSQGNGPKSITPALLEFAGLFETITDKWFQIKRTGSGQTDTSYLLTPLNEHGLNVEGYELFDLKKVTRNVPYEEQEVFYNRGVERVQDAPAAEEKPTQDARASEW